MAFSVNLTLSLILSCKSLKSFSNFVIFSNGNELYVSDSEIIFEFIYLDTFVVSLMSVIILLNFLCNYKITTSVLLDTEILFIKSY